MEINLLTKYPKTKRDPSQRAEVKTEERPIAKVSLVGAGMIGRPRVAAKMFETLAAAGINMIMISTSEVKVSCIVDAEDCEKAINSLSLAFDVNVAGCSDGALKPRPCVTVVVAQQRTFIALLP